MSRKQLIERGYPNWEAFFFDLMVRSRSGPESTQDMFLELKTVERRSCMSYLGDMIYQQDADALQALKTIANIL